MCKTISKWPALACLLLLIIERCHIFLLHCSLGNLLTKGRKHGNKQGNKSKERKEDEDAKSLQGTPEMNVHVLPSDAPSQIGQYQTLLCYTFSDISSWTDNMFPTSLRSIPHMACLLFLIIGRCHIISSFGSPTKVLNEKRTPKQ
jgi:hypothetical protein